MHAERDYLYGLVLSGTGMRREEAAYLLACEVPAPTADDRVATITRYGKGNKARPVLLPGELVRHAELYRRTERAALVATAQRSLRQRLDAGSLTSCEIEPGRAEPIVSYDGRRSKASLVPNEDRKRLVSRGSDGILEPAALFLGRSGVPLRLAQWNDIFARASERVARDDPDSRPDVGGATTPHVMRHTYAVRMLAGLMALGRDRAADPYLLLKNPVLVVQQLLGHTSPETTYGYLRVADGYDSHVPTVLTAMVASVTA